MNHLDFLFSHHYSLRMKNQPTGESRTTDCSMGVGHPDHYVLVVSAAWSISDLQRDILSLTEQWTGVQLGIVSEAFSPRTHPRVLSPRLDPFLAVGLLFLTILCPGAFRKLGEMSRRTGSDPSCYVYLPLSIMLST